MPGMNGVELYHNLASSNPTLASRMILITGSPRAQQELLLQGVKANSFSSPSLGLNWSTPCLAFLRTPKSAPTSHLPSEVAPSLYIKPTVSFLTQPFHPFSKLIWTQSGSLFSIRTFKPS